LLEKKEAERQKATQELEDQEKLDHTDALDYF